MNVKTLVARTALAPVAWGTTYLVVSEVLPPGRPLFDAAVRVVPAGLALVLLARARGGRPPVGREWRRTALVGTAQFGLFFPLLVLAASLLPGGVAAAAGGLQPLLVLALTGLLDRRRPAGRDLLLGAAAAAGVALVVLRPDAGYSAVGVVAAVAANASFAAAVVLTRRFPRPADPVGDTGWQLVVSGAVLVPLALLVEGPPPVLSGPQLGGVAWFSLVATAGAFLLWSDGVRRLPVLAPPLLGLAAPLTGAALGWAVLGQDLTALQLLGFAVTGAAVVAGAVRGSRGPAGPPPGPAAPVPCGAAASGYRLP